MGSYSELPNSDRLPEIRQNLPLVFVSAKEDYIGHD